MAFPHSDPLVLHAMGTCEKCDQFEELQMERCELFMNFTGKNFTEGVKGEPMTPCPSEGGPTAAAKRKALEAAEAAKPTPMTFNSEYGSQVSQQSFIFKCLIHGDQTITGSFAAGENITLACAKCLAVNKEVDMIDGVPIERYEDLTKDVKPVDAEILSQMNGGEGIPKVEAKAEADDVESITYGWEYRVETILYDDDSFDEEKEVSRMNALGKQKWELVCVVPFGPVGFRHYYRRLTEGGK